MRNFWLLAAILAACPICSWAIYGPSLARADVPLPPVPVRKGASTKANRLLKRFKAGNQTKSSSCSPTQ